MPGPGTLSEHSSARLSSVDRCLQTRDTELPDALDVTDLFDGFHRVVAALWREFGSLLSATAAEEIGVGFDEVVDQLEVDLFLPACARQLLKMTGEVVDPDEIASRIRLGAESGEFLPGAGGQYHSHAFHPESPEADVPNAVLTASLMAIPRADVRLLIGPPVTRRRVGSRRDLPLH